jgi:hypothetical protein
MHGSRHFDSISILAKQLVLITGEAFFYAEVGQPSQVELFLFHGVRKIK